MKGFVLGMKLGTIHTIIRKLCGSEWIQPLSICIICAVSYWQLRDKIFSDQTIIVINVILLLFGLFLAFKWIRQKKSVECWFYCILMFASIFNHLYEPQVFEELFHIPFSYGTAAILIYGIIRITWWYIYKFLRGVANIAEEAAEGLMSKELNKQTILQNRASHNMQTNPYTQKLYESKQGEIDERESLENGPSQDAEKTTNLANILTTSNRKVLAILIAFSLIIPLVCGFVFFTSVAPLIESYSKGSDFKAVMTIINISISIFTMLILLLIMWAAFLGLLIEIWIGGKKLFYDLNRSLINTGENTSFPTKLLIHTITVVVICIYWSNNAMFTTDDLNDLLSNGQLFIYPVAIAIIIPVYFVLVDWITNKKHWTAFLNSNKVKEVKTLLLDISAGTTIALLNFVKFVTSDFLLSIQGLSIDEEDTEYNSNDNYDSLSNGDDT